MRGNFSSNGLVGQRKKDKRRSGQAMVEYALLTVATALALVGFEAQFEGSLKEVFNKIGILWSSDAP